ncbi:MAG: hypothetical protein WC408_01675 [Candidatus Micrarchaeia archaeon]|jgi:uncharacterized membrane protein
MNKLRALGYASLVVGGFLVLSFVVVAYFALWQHEFFLISPSGGARIVAASQQNNTTMFTTIGRFNGSWEGGQNNTSFERRPPDPHNGSFVVNLSVDPLSQVLSPAALGILLMGVFFLFNGFVLLDHTQKRDRHETRKFVISSLLTGDEKLFYDELVKTNGEATQKQLSNSTGFSAVKTYRVLKRLESKKIVRSFPFGMTNKIVLNEQEK